MMLERMGTMGSTQGVKARPTPPRKNSAAASSQPRSANREASRRSSVVGGGRAAGVGEPCSATPSEGAAPSPKAAGAASAEAEPMAFRITQRVSGG